jgi:very-short-patch-repair endonuclease
VTSERTEFARAPRKHPTRAMGRLRASHSHGAKFRRQVPFDRFVVDFYCHAAKSVVELDGKQRAWLRIATPGGPKCCSAPACAS